MKTTAIRKLFAAFQAVPVLVGLLAGCVPSTDDPSNNSWVEIDQTAYDRSK